MKTTAAPSAGISYNCTTLLMVLPRLLHQRCIYESVLPVCPQSICLSPIGNLSFSPVVVCVVPVVEMYQEVVINNIGDRGDTDKSRVLPVDRLQLHPHPKPTALRHTGRKTDSGGETELYTGCSATGEQTDRCILTAVRQVNSVGGAASELED